MFIIILIFFFLNKFSWGAIKILEVMAKLLEQSHQKEERGQGHVQGRQVKPRRGQ